MKISKAQILRRVYSIPEIRFEDQRLSSYSGLVVIQELFKRLQLRSRLAGMFSAYQKQRDRELPCDYVAVDRSFDVGLSTASGNGTI